MAIDRALLDDYVAGGPPTLRLYDWTPTTLSLGYAQPWTDVDHAACDRAGVMVVRRPTGGRAVLHGLGDLTYSLVASEREGFPTSVAGSYGRIAEAIALALTRMGIDATLAPGDRRPGVSAACFETATRADLMAQGRKLVGSAQLRVHGGFLQHGTILLTQDPAAISPLLNRRKAPEGMTNLKELLGRAPSQHEVAEALVAGFSRALGIALNEEAVPIG